LPPDARTSSEVTWSMIRKSENRFYERIMLKQEDRVGMAIRR
jgi:hypothetical protein